MLVKHLPAAKRPRLRLKLFCTESDFSLTAWRCTILFGIMVKVFYLKYRDKIFCSILHNKKLPGYRTQSLQADYESAWRKILPFIRNGKGSCFTLQFC